MGGFNQGRGEKGRCCGCRLDLGGRSDDCGFGWWRFGGGNGGLWFRRGHVRRLGESFGDGGR
jgi:hypothetical protein